MDIDLLNNTNMYFEEYNLKNINFTVFVKTKKNFKIMLSLGP